MKKLAVIAAAALATLAPQWAAAESSYVTGGTGDATARLDFRVVIPRVLFLQVGTGSIAPLADNATIDQVSFEPTAAVLGDGSNVTATTNGTVTLRVFGNSGNIGLTATTTGNLTNAAGNTIPWSEILATSAAPGAPASGWTAANITPPAFTAGGGTSASVPLTATNGIVRVESAWTFTYDNSTVYAAGTYGTGTGTNGRVTYTASAP